MVTCTGFIQPLNLECLVMNMFAGNAIIFVAIAFLFIAGLSARFRMSNAVTLITMGLFGVIFSKYMPGIYMLIIVVVSFFVYSTIKRLVSRN